KTAEYLTDYAYKAPNGVTVQFTLQNANVEQNNEKGEKRFFVPLPDRLEWNPQTRTLTLPFEFRPLTGEEKARFGDQNALLCHAETDLLSRVKENP
ncbi:MAG: hypothetical protein NZ869_11470, partial [Thermoanaerobaculum sp.]|nr:hypothetical protein [Thermoanaerobaculum sp.]